MLSREWHEITGDSFIVDVRPISQDDPVSGFIEVFKYAVKFSDQNQPTPFTPGRSSRANACLPAPAVSVAWTFPRS